jgi:hypothetical protein
MLLNESKEVRPIQGKACELAHLYADIATLRKALADLETLRLAEKPR